MTSVFQNTLFKIQEKALIPVLDVVNTLQIPCAAHSAALIKNWIAHFLTT